MQVLKYIFLSPQALFNASKHVQKNLILNLPFLRLHAMQASATVTAAVICTIVCYWFETSKAHGRTA